MRRGVFILICCLGLFIQAAGAAEVLLGTVETVDSSQGVITLRVIDGSGEDDAQPPSGLMDVAIDPENIPDGLERGDTIRVWGEYAGDSETITFQADSIRRRFSGNRLNDPTGVRSRLGWGAGGQGGQRGRMGSGRSSGRR